MGMTLKALRINRGLDQKVAASALGVAPDTLGSWERGITFPNVPQISALENFYGVSYADINFFPQNVGLNDKSEGVTA